MEKMLTAGVPDLYERLLLAKLLSYMEDLQCGKVTCILPHYSLTTTRSQKRSTTIYHEVKRWRLTMRRAALVNRKLWPRILFELERREAELLRLEASLDQVRTLVIFRFRILLQRFLSKMPEDVPDLWNSNFTEIQVEEV